MKLVGLPRSPNVGPLPAYHSPPLFCRIFSKGANHFGMNSSKNSFASFSRSA